MNPVGEHYSEKRFILNGDHVRYPAAFLNWFSMWLFTSIAWEVKKKTFILAVLIRAN